MCSELYMFTTVNNDYDANRDGLMFGSCRVYNHAQFLDKMYKILSTYCKEYNLNFKMIMKIIDILVQYGKEFYVYPKGIVNPRCFIEFKINKIETGAIARFDGPNDTISRPDPDTLNLHYLVDRVYYDEPYELPSGRSYLHLEDVNQDDF